MDVKIDFVPEAGLYHLTFDHARVSLSRAELEALVLQAVKHLPGLVPGVEVTEDEDVYRIPMRRLMDMGDRDIQLLLREVQSEDLVKALWFMDDPALSERVFANLSHRTREVLQGDLKDFAAIHARLGERAQAKNRGEAVEAAKRLIAAIHALGENGQAALL
jgi:hypothetical protein